MFYPSQKRELLRGICYFISDSATYRCFALVSVYCSRLAKEYAPMKKKEFTKCVCGILPRLGYERVYILPNLRLHGHFGYRIGDNVVGEDTFLNGKRVGGWTHHMHRFYLSNYNPTNYIPTNYISLVVKRVIVNLYEDLICFNNRTTISANLCTLCKRFHTFVYSGDDGNLVCLSKSCISKGRLHMRIMSYEESRKMQRRARIARAIIDYAQETIKCLIKS